MNVVTVPSHFSLMLESPMPVVTVVVTEVDVGIDVVGVLLAVSVTELLCEDVAVDDCVVDGVE